MGRPKFKIPWDKVDNLFISGCTGIEVSAAIGMFSETFYKKVQEEKGMKMTEYRSTLFNKGNAILRAAQYDEAVTNRDKSMLVWLGKNRLGQKDKQEISLEIVDIVTEI